MRILVNSSRRITVPSRGPITQRAIAANRPSVPPALPGVSQLDPLIKGCERTALAMASDIAAGSFGSMSRNRS